MSNVYWRMLVLCGAFVCRTAVYSSWIRLDVFLKFDFENQLVTFWFSTMSPGEYVNPVTSHYIYERFHCLTYMYDFILRGEIRQR